MSQTAVGRKKSKLISCGTSLTASVKAYFCRDSYDKRDSVRQIEAAVLGLVTLENPLVILHYVGRMDDIFPRVYCKQFQA